MFPKTNNRPSPVTFGLKKSFIKKTFPMHCTVLQCRKMSKHLCNLCMLIGLCGLRRTERVEAAEKGAKKTKRGRNTTNVELQSVDLLFWSWDSQICRTAFGHTRFIRWTFHEKSDKFKFHCLILEGKSTRAL